MRVRQTGSSSPTSTLKKVESRALPARSSFPMNAMSAAAIVDSTIGAGLLDLLEQTAIRGRLPGVGWDQPLQSSSPSAVDEAAELVPGLPFGDLLKLAVLATGCGGSYWGLGRGAPSLRHRHDRSPIAQAIAARPDAFRWSEPAARRQWWWTDGHRPLTGELGDRLDELAWTWSTRPAHALLTTSPFPDDMLATGVEAPLDLVWDVCFGPRARWQLDVQPDGRIFQIDTPNDWADLVQRYPSDASEAYRNGHEISSLNDKNDRDGLAALTAIPGQRAVRRGWRRFLTPDWPAVAQDWDAIHLSWAGYVLVDGTAIDLDDDDITMLRNWGSERTTWLAPVLRDPKPLPIPGSQHSDVRRPDDPAWEQERTELTRFACHPTKST